MDNIRVIAPADWQVKDKKAALIVLSNGNGLLTYFSDKLAQPQTVAQLLQGDLAADQKIDPNAKVCKGPAPSPMTGMPPGGMYETICFTNVPQQGQSYPAQDIWFEAVSADGSTEFAIGMFAPQDKIQGFIAAFNAAHIRSAWKLPQ